MEDRRDRENMYDSLGVEKGVMVKFPLVPLPFVSFRAAPASRFSPSNKKLNNHIVEIHKDPSS